MSIKISELPSATSVGANDYIPIVQGGTTKKATGGMLENYSTNEQRVGTWIDGKPLYRKVFQITTIPQVTTDGTVASSDGGLIDNNTTFAFIENAFAISDSNTIPSTIQTLPYINNSGRQLKCQVSASSRKLHVYLISNGTVYNNYYKVIVSVLYTKTTDTAVRGVVEQTRGIKLTKGEAIEEDDSMITPVEKEEEPIDETKVSGDKEDIGDDPVDEQTK